MYQMERLTGSTAMSPTRPDMKAGPIPRNFIAETKPEFIPGASSLGSSESWASARKFPADRARPTDKIQCLSMANFDGVPGCNSTESEKDSRRTTLIRLIGHCYGQPARIARKEPRTTGSHGRQKTGRRATTEHTEHTEVRKARKRGNHGTHRTHGSQESTEEGQPRKGRGDRWNEVVRRGAGEEEAW